MPPSLQSKRPPVPNGALQRDPPPTPKRQTLAYNPAVRHPVFFTNLLKKAPPGAIVREGLNPAATGYAYATGGSKL